MPGKSYRNAIKRFLINRKVNTVGLVLITLMCMIVTVFLSFFGFKHIDVLILITVLFVVLCILRVILMKYNFKTLRTKIRRRKSSHHNGAV